MDRKVIPVAANWQELLSTPVQFNRPAPQQKKKSFWLDQLSTLGGIGGGILGSAVAPIVGTAGGAGAGSALGEAIENLITGDSMTKNLAKEGALGAVFGAGPLKLLKGAGAGAKALATGADDVVGAASKAAQTSLIKKAGSKVAGAVGGNVTDRATTSFLKLTPSQTQRLLDAGVDPANLARRASQFGSSPAEIIGKAGNGGPLQQTISALEKGIQTTAKTAGNNVRIPGDEIIRALKAQRSSIGRELGGGARLKQLNQIIKDAEKKYSKGVTVQQARSILKEANERFGASVLDDTGDAIARAAQKLEGNTMREALKSRFPSIASALDDQSDLIQVREILKRARAIEKTQKFNVGRFDITRPGSFIDPLLNNPRVSGRMLGRGAVEAGAQPAGVSSLGIGARQVGQNLLRSGQSEGGDMSEMTTASTSPMTNMTANAPIISDMGESYNNQSIESSPFSPANIETNVKAIMQNGGSLSDVMEYIKVAEAINKLTGGTQAKPLNQAQQERSDLVSALDMTENVVNQGSINYGPIGSRVEGLKSMFNAADPETLTFKNTVSGLRAAITKARAGASLTAGELKLLEKYTPSDTDSEQVVRSKLAQLRALYGGTAPTQGSSSLEDALMQYAQ